VIYAAGIIPGTLKVILAQPPISPNAIWNISCNPATALIKKVLLLMIIVKVTIVMLKDIGGAMKFPHL
jgi:hypothetical protein